MANYTLDARRLVTFSPPPGVDPRTAQKLNVGPYFSKLAHGVNQLGGVKAAPRAHGLKKPFARKVLDQHPYDVDIRDHCYVAYEAMDTLSPFSPFLLGPAATDWDHVPIDASDEYKVISKLRKRAFGSDFNPGIFAAEMPEALSMIGSSAKRIRRGMLCLAAGDMRGVFHNLREPTGVHGNKQGLVHSERIREATIGFHDGRKTFANAWLELSYGWKPLVKDIESGCAYIADAINGPGANLNRVSAKRTGQKVAILMPTAGNIQLTRKTTKYVLKYVITGLKSPNRFLPTLPSVASVAWEKLPYSFVCDWVVPVGDYLDALRTAGDIQGTVVRTLYRETTWDEPRWGSRFTGIRTLQPDLAYKFRMVSSVRTVAQEINPPVPVGDLSPSHIFSSLERTLNAVSLLQNLRFNPKDRTGIRKLLGQDVG